MPAEGRGRSSGVHVIVGDSRNGFDSYRAEESVVHILADFNNGTVGEIESLRGDETTWTRLLDSARTPSLFAPRRAIVVRGAEGTKGDPQELEPYLDDPNPGVALILVAAKPDGRKVAWKTLLARAAVVKAEPLKGNALRSRVVDELRRRGLAMSEEGLLELIDLVGQDLRRLMGEIDKLQAFWDGKSPLSAETVAAVSGRGFAPPLYRLGDALLGRRLGEVVALVEETLAEGEAGPLVLGVLYRTVRQVRGVHALGGSRAARQEIASRLRIPPFKLDEVLSAARRWPEGDLSRATEAFGAADRQMKLGADARVALCAALVEACGRP